MSGFIDAINNSQGKDQLKNLLDCSGCRPAIPYLLPEDFKVYTNGRSVINHPFPGFQERTLPTFNDYLGEDGGYVAIYSREQEGSIYGVGGGIYVMGQIRVKGHYEGRIFIPEGYRSGDDITGDRRILQQCEQHLPELKGKMWIGGDTGGWFGIQR
ncbi:MAG: hypothetical protein KF898_07590 [Parachlamydiales bacterium]|nr:hypothetical protein [Candidatus Acheromyda pituitae]